MNKIKNIIKTACVMLMVVSGMALARLSTGSEGNVAADPARETRLAAHQLNAIKQMDALLAEYTPGMRPTLRASASCPLGELVDTVSVLAARMHSLNNGAAIAGKHIQRQVLQQMSEYLNALAPYRDYCIEAKLQSCPTDEIKQSFKLQIDNFTRYRTEVVENGLTMYDTSLQALLREIDNQIPAPTQDASGSAIRSILSQLFSLTDNVLTEIDQVELAFDELTKIHQGLKRVAISMARSLLMHIYQQSSLT